MIYHRYFKQQKAFTLVELSIVLVIIALVVGGILGAQSLIRSSELQSVISERNKLATAVHAFKDKYFYLPGDLPNATSLWGAAHATPTTCALTTSTSISTCNGNGDNIIYPIAYNPGGGAAYVPYEGARFWQHLANAALIEGQYTGYPATYFAGGGSGISYPSKLKGGYWTTFNHTVLGGFTYTFNIDTTTGHAFTLGGIGSGVSFSLTPLMTPYEVWSVDTKMDDGKPAQGKVAVYAPNGLNLCTDAVGAPAVQKTLLDSNYLLTSDSVQCNVTFRQQY